MSAVCALCLPKRNLPYWPKGHRGGGRGSRPGTGPAQVENSRGKRGGQQTLVSWVPFLAAAEAVEALASLPHEVWAARRYAALGEGGWPSVMGWWVLRPWALRTGCPGEAGPAGAAGGLGRGCPMSWLRHSGRGWHRCRPHKPSREGCSSARGRHAAGVPWGPWQTQPHPPHRGSHGAGARQTVPGSCYELWARRNIC